MAVTKTVTRSYGKRVGDSFKGVIGGLIAIVAGIVLLWWNEGNSVKTYQALKEGRKECVEAPYDKVDDALDGKLVHVSGKAATAEVLNDEVFKFEVNAIALSRQVEMYQWVQHEESETDEKFGGSEETMITYTYTKEWRSDWIDSSGFEEAGHNNPSSFEYESKDYRARSVSFGAYELTESQIDRIGGDEELPPSKSAWVLKQMAEAPEGTTVSGLTDVCKIAGMSVRGKYFYLPKNPKKKSVTATETTSTMTTEANTTETSSAEAGAGAVVEAGGPSTPPAEAAPAPAVAEVSEPEVGDIRISFTYIPPEQTISIIARQVKNTFEGWTAKSGKTLDMLVSGTKSANEMFSSAESANKMLTWILRLIGFILMGSGFSAVFKPLPMLLAFVPFLRKIVSAGVGVVAWLLAFILSLLVIAIAWLFYRPVLSIVLIAAVVGIIVLIKKMKGQATEVAEATSASDSSAEAAPAPAEENKQA